MHGKRWLELWREDEKESRKGGMIEKGKEKKVTKGIKKQNSNKNDGDEKQNSFIKSNFNDVNSMRINEMQNKNLISASNRVIQKPLKEFRWESRVMLWIEMMSLCQCKWSAAEKSLWNWVKKVSNGFNTLMETIVISIAESESKSHYPFKCMDYF